MALKSPLKVLSNEELLKILSNISEMPTLPTIMANIMKVTDDPKSGTDDLTKILKFDPALSTKILKVSNSAFYAQVMPVTSISRSIMVIGFNEIKNIAISAVIIKSFPKNSKIAHFDLKELWKHSLGTAFGAKLIAEKIGGVSPDDAFIAGLLHDIGKVIISQFLPKYFQIIYHYVSSLKLTMYECEKEILGETHSVVGEWLCKMWKLPEIVRLSVGKHHTPVLSDLLFSKEIITSVNIVALSNSITKLLKIGSGGNDVSTVKINPEVIQYLNLNSEDLKKIMLDISKTKSAIDSFF
jgi:putative nucleotidyltransferase with HDIG domain